MGWILLVFELLAAVPFVFGTIVTAANNNDWHVDGQRTVLPVEGCPNFNSALLLHPGSNATYQFEGTGIRVLGAAFEQGVEALIELEGQTKHFDALSPRPQCATFAEFNGLDPSRSHTIQISIPAPQGGSTSGFPIGGLDIATLPGSQLDPKPGPAAGPPSGPGPAPPGHQPSKPSATSSSPPTHGQIGDDHTLSSTSDSNDHPVSTKPPESTEGGNGPYTSNDHSSTKTGSDANPTKSSPSTIESVTLKPSNTVFPPGLTSSPADTSPTSNLSSSERSRVNASVLVPAILLPVLSLFAIGAFMIWVVRRRHRTRIPPSAMFLMEHPELNRSNQMSEVSERAPSRWMAEGQLH